MSQESNQKPTLNALIESLDNDVMTEQEAKELRYALEEKIDAYAMVQSQMAAEVERLKGIAREFAEEAKLMESRLKKFNERVLYVMDVNGFEKLPGERFQLVQTLNPPSVKVEADPCDLDADAYPDLVRIKYEWSLTAIKAAITEGRDIPFARLVRGKKPVFKVRKGV